MKSIFDLVIRENIVDIHLFKSYLPKKMDEEHVESVSF